MGRRHSRGHRCDRFVSLPPDAPLLTGITGFGEAAISPILLLFGAGLVAGNLLGGRLADRAPVPAMIGSLALLFVVLVVMGPALQGTMTALVAVTLLGAAAFATVPPLQMWVLSKADGAGESLASSFNIAAFNLGNAVGAFAGGLVIDSGPGLGYVTWTAALFPLAALAVALTAVRLDRAAPERQPAQMGYAG
jgi:DHA1 family inner membrane transport protein